MPCTLGKRGSLRIRMLCSPIPALDCICWRTAPCTAMEQWQSAEEAQPPLSPPSPRCRHRGHTLDTCTGRSAESAAHAHRGTDNRSCTSDRASTRLLTLEHQLWHCAVSISFAMCEEHFWSNRSGCVRRGGAIGAAGGTAQNVHAWQRQKPQCVAACASAPVSYTHLTLPTICSV
eukprot:3448099-Prymnesium_polylepis.1